jgi:ADP-heptose:LPS heptosyltransferase
MGDILLSTPTLRALAAHYQTTEIDYIVGPGNAEALTGTPYIREVMVFAKATDARAKVFLPFLQRLRAARYELFLNFQPGAKTELMALASGARQQRRLHKDLRIHAIDDFARVVAPLGVQVTDRQMDFVVPAAAHESAERLLAAQGIRPEQGFVAINPGASHTVNRWPPERFAALFQRLDSAHPELGRVVLGGPSDSAVAGQIAQEATVPVVNLAGKMSVKELGAVLQRAAVLVTADTGPQHVAAAVGTPLVSLFGAADPARTGPIDVPSLVVFNEALGCVPCRSRTCRRGDTACMNQLPVERVLDAIERQRR